MKIEKEICPYRPLRGKPRKKITDVPIIYELDDGPINVLKWFRWPSYDFIFGVPGKKNKFHGKEVGFFQYRDSRRKKVVEGFYFDLIEMGDLIDGFNSIREHCDCNS